jgi:hypothetical protein
MRNTILKATFAAATLALAGQLLAGGFLLVLGNPDASPEARRLNAVLTVQAAGCHDPATATLSATAIGVVNGRRREIPLNVQRLSSPGMFALAQQWPSEGRWVIKLVGRNGEQFTNSLVRAEPAGPDRLHGQASMREFTAAEVDALLQ